MVLEVVDNFGPFRSSIVVGSSLTADQTKAFCF